MPGRVAEITLERPSTRGSQKAITDLARAAMFAALAVGAGFALLLVPNVELITAIVFVAGVYLGARWGLTVGMLAEFVFSAANPMGSGLMYMPVMIAQVIGIGMAGMAGGLLGNIFRSREWPLAKVIILGAVGATLTILYDFLTTAGIVLIMSFDTIMKLTPGEVSGFVAKQTVAFYLAGAGFALLHQASNAVIFATALPRIFSRIDL